MNILNKPVTLMNGDSLHLDYKGPGGTFQLVPVDDPKARYSKDKDEFKLVSGGTHYPYDSDRENLEKVIVPCSHCNQPGAVLTTCRFCGAPIIKY